eukprot:6143560-Prorocentrum_lima.AAC.1
MHNVGLCHGRIGRMLSNNLRAVEPGCCGRGWPRGRHLRGSGNEMRDVGLCHGPVSYTHLTLPTICSV